MKQLQINLANQFLSISDLDEKISICKEMSNQRSFDWQKWEFGFRAIEKPDLLELMNSSNLLKLILLLVENDKISAGFLSQNISSGFVEKLISTLLLKNSTILDYSKNFSINPKFDFRADTPPNKDPDLTSETLKQYHKKLWSKKLPDGSSFILDDDVPKKYLYHSSDLGVFHVTSDSISHTYRDTKRLQNIIVKIPNSDMEVFYNSCFAIGGYILFPGDVRKGYQTINQARGCNHKIVDRFDITLECIRRHFLSLPSPLQNTLQGYGDFFELFIDFQKYVEFFHLQDLVSSDFKSIKFHLPFSGEFEPQAFPKDEKEYEIYMQNTLSFIRSRTQRIMQQIPRD